MPSSGWAGAWIRCTIGDTVTVSGVRAKNDESMNIGQAKITAADGHKVFDGNAPGHEAAAP